MTAEAVPVVVSPGACDVAAIKARADAATPGPWDIFRYQNGTGRIHVDQEGRRRQLIADVESATDVVATVYDEADREFLFHARSDVPALVAEVERLRAALNTVRDPHVMDRSLRRIVPFCNADNETWPCETVRAIDAALGVQS